MRQVEKSRADEEENSNNEGEKKSSAVASMSNRTDV